MKRLVALLFSILLAVVLCACEKAVQIPDIPQTFEAQAVIEIGDNSYSGSYRQLSPSVYSFVVSKPESLAGLTASLENAVNTLSFNGLGIDASDKNSSDIFGPLNEIVGLCLLEDEAVQNVQNGYIREYTTKSGIARIHQDASSGLVTGVEYKGE